MLPYTAIFQTTTGSLRVYTATASNDRHVAWAQMSALKENEEEWLILLVPGNHPVIRYEDIKKTEEEIDLFSNY